jgi:hypothetical protein
MAERERERVVSRERERKRRRLEELERKIADTEAEVARLAGALAGDHGGDWQKLHGLVDEKERTEARLRSFLGEWEKLGAELEGA